MSIFFYKILTFLFQSIYMAIKIKKKLNQQTTNKLDKILLSFLDTLVILSKNLKLIFYLPLVLCSLMILYDLFLVNPAYVSTSKVTFSSASDGNIGKSLGFAPQLWITIPAIGQGPNWVYSEIIKTRSLAKAVLKRKFNTDEFSIQKSLLQILT